MKKVLLIAILMFTASCASNQNSMDYMVSNSNSAISQKIEGLNVGVKSIEKTIEKSEKSFIESREDLGSNIESYMQITSKINSKLYMGIKPHEESNGTIMNLFEKGLDLQVEISKNISNMKRNLIDLKSNDKIFNFIENSISNAESNSDISRKNIESIKAFKRGLKITKSSNFMSKKMIERDVVRNINFLENEKILYSKLKDKIQKGGFYDIPRQEVKAKSILFKKTEGLNKNISKNYENPKLDDRKKQEKNLIQKISNFSGENRSHRYSIFQPMNNLLKQNKNISFKIKSIAKTSEEALNKAIEIIEVLNAMGLPANKMSVQTEVRDITISAIKIYKY